MKNNQTCVRCVNDKTIKKISFNDVPQTLALILNKVEKLETLLQNNQSSEPADRWLNLQELCNYLPDHPAKQTVYGWIVQRAIPYHKTGKKLQFRKSEIDEWIQKLKNLPSNPEEDEDDGQLSLF